MPDATAHERRVTIGIDVKDGDVVLIASPGAFREFKQQDGSFQQKLKIEIQCVEGQVKELILNETSRKALTLEYGKMTEEWVGMPVLANILSQKVPSGDVKKVLYLAPIKGATKKELKPQEKPWTEEE